jgi:ATP-dependent RNA helicase RhlE
VETGLQYLLHIMSFAALGLSEPLVRACADTGYTTPTPIQSEAIPAVLAGGDLLAGAQTGTGKTAGFVLPILERLSANPIAAAPPRTDGRPASKVQARPLRALILTPTRELAAQVEASVRVYGKHLKLKSIAVFGGVGFGPQASALRAGVDILVATPGRLLDHHQQRTVDFSKVEIFVLDEADRMLDMGFIHDIKRIMALMPNAVNGVRRQNLLFSATFSDDIKALADKLLDHPKTIQIAQRNSTVEVIAQKVHPVDRDKKRQLLTHLIREHNWQQVLVFARTKHGANRLAEQLDGDGIPSMAIHGNKSQGARTAALAKFKANKLQVLVATDIAARGIDIDQLPHVVNYELPNVAEDYIHRIGRTGRAGATGEAISLVCVDEGGLLRDIERLIKRSLPKEVVLGFEPDPRIRAEPILRTQNRGGPSRNGASAPRSNGFAKPRGEGFAKKSFGDAPRPSGHRPSGPKPAGNAGHGAANRSGAPRRPRSGPSASTGSSGR